MGEWAFRAGCVEDVCREVVRLDQPGVGAVDGLAVETEPVSHLEQPLLKVEVDSAVGCWADVEQQVAAIRHGRRQLVDQLFSSEEVFHFRFSSVPPAVLVERHRILPFVVDDVSGVELVAARVEAAMPIGGVRRPPVIDDDLFPDGRLIVQPRHELTVAPILLRRLPLTVAPHYVRPVSLDQVIELWVTDVPWVVACGLEGPCLVAHVEGIEPLEMREVQTETKTRSIAHCVHQVFDEIPMRPDVDRVPVPRLS
mmetsp:Transcript_21538/g.61341  ORF Transcript_21538/g.61341 Transcript_21538/m.61341 type:complete len:254 (+) Transcript_21538:758-1519(+)